MEHTENTEKVESTENTGKSEDTAKKNNAAEDLNSYLNVTGVGPWFVVLTAAVVLAGIAVWLLFGKVQTEIKGAGYCENGSICCYFDLGEITKLTKGTVVEIQGVDTEGAQGTVTEVGTSLYRDYDLPNEVLFLVSDADWYGTVQISCDLEDGLYSASYTEESTAMASFTNKQGG